MFFLDIAPIYVPVPHTHKFFSGQGVCFSECRSHFCRGAAPQFFVDREGGVGGRDLDNTAPSFLDGHHGASVY